jgi:hypothetical protein
VSVSAPRVGAMAVVGLVSAVLFSSVPPSAFAVEISQPVQVAVIVPLSVKAGASGILTATELASATAPGGYLQRVLSSVNGTAATLAIDPMVIASIRLLGTDAPPSALVWLDSLANSTNDTFALSYADSDITVALQAGSGEVLAPTSFDFAINPSRFAQSPAVATPTPTATPTATVAPEGTTDGSTTDGTTNGAENTDPASPPPLPTTSSLTQWNYTIPDVAWPIAGTATNADVAAIIASGYTKTILSSGNVQRTSGAIAAVAGGVVAGGAGNADLIITDDEGTSQLEYALAAQTEPLWVASIDRLSSRITAVGTRSSSAPTMVISTARSELLNIDRLLASMTAIDALPGAMVVGLSDISESSTTSAQIVDQPNVPSTIGLVVPMLQAEAADRAFSAVAERPELISGERRIQLLAALAPQWDRYLGGWGSAVAEFSAQSLTLRDSVRVIESSEIIFAADRGLLPLTVRNDLNQPVTVVITVRPRTPLLSIENTQFELAIEPDSQRRALIPAQSRSNGLVELVVSIRTLDGLSIGANTTVTTRVQAGWETPVTLTFGVIVVLMFGFGLIRTVRKRRAARAVVPE